MATCLVTGGAGFLGSHLCDELLARGHRVICVDNFETGSLANIEHIRDPERFAHLNVDIIEPYFVEEPVDFVYHLASPGLADRLPAPAAAHAEGRLLRHAPHARAREGQARALPDRLDQRGLRRSARAPAVRETYWGHVNPIGPRGVYDEAKRYAEALTMAYHRQQGVDTAIVRIFNTYGSRMRPHDGRAIPTFLRQALANRPITVFGDGSQTRSFCYVSDLIRGIIALAESGYHDPVNIGNPDEFTLLELAETVSELTGSSRRSSSRRCPSTIRSSAGPTSRSPASCSAGRPRCRCARGCGARSRTRASRCSSAAALADRPAPRRSPRPAGWTAPLRPPPEVL